MRRFLVKLGSVAAIAAASLAFGTQAFAGLRSLRPVYVQRQSNGFVLAEGGLSGARLSPDTRQYIGCRSGTFVGVGFTSDSVICFAQDSAGVFVACAMESTDPGFQAVRDVVQLVSTTSRISFVSNNSGKCNSIRVEDSSYEIP